MTTTRRLVLLAAAGTVLAPAATHATPAALALALKAFAGERPVADGPVTIDIAPLVENGNAVPVTVAVDHPMTEAAHIRRIGLFNERNPLPEIAVFELTPASGLAQVSTRIRLSSSQQLVALAQTSDGRILRGKVDVVVTLAACIEG